MSIDLGSEGFRGDWVERYLIALRGSHRQWLAEWAGLAGEGEAECEAAPHTWHRCRGVVRVSPKLPAW